VNLYSPRKPSPAISCRALACARERWNPGPSRIGPVDLDLEAGGIYGFCGPDGCGKGLLLHLLGLLETPDAGTIELFGTALPPLGSEKHQRWRMVDFGYLFPSPFLLPSLSVAENIAMPLFRGLDLSAEEARDRTREALARCQIESLEAEAVWKLPEDLRHRIALARALAHHPRFLIAVSPATSENLLPLARLAASELGITILWAGPAELLQGICTRTFQIDAGEVREAVCSP